MPSAAKIDCSTTASATNYASFSIGSGTWRGKQAPFGDGYNDQTVSWDLGLALSAPRPPSCGPNRRRKPHGQCQQERGALTERSSYSQAADDVVDLREANASLQARCDWQASELRELRRRLSDLEDCSAVTPACILPPSAPGSGATPRRPGCSRPVLAPVPKQKSRALDQGTQTLVFEDDMTEHERQLDAAHEKAGEKSREFIRAQQNIAALQEHLRLQVRLAEQYKEEVATLEEQLLRANTLKQRLEDEKQFAEWQLIHDKNVAGRSGLRTPRTSGAEAWGDVDDGCRANLGSSGDCMTGSVSQQRPQRCWSASRRTRPSTIGGLSASQPQPPSASFPSTHSARLGDGDGDNEEFVDEDSPSSTPRLDRKDEAAFEESISSDADSESITPLPPRLRAPHLPTAT